MNKHEVLRNLEEGLKIEESAIPIYVRHINSTLFLSGFNKHDSSRIKEILESLARETEKHKRIFSRLREMVEASEQDVY